MPINMISALKNTMWHNDAGGGITIHDLDAGKTKAVSLPATLHSKKGEFGMEMVSVDEAKSTFTLRTTKFGVHVFTWDGGSTLSEKPADLWDQLTFRAPIVWKQVDEVVKPDVGFHMALPSINGGPKSLMGGRGVCHGSPGLCSYGERGRSVAPNSSRLAKALLQSAHGMGLMSRS